MSAAPATQLFTARVLFGVIAFATALVALFRPMAAQAHCDSVKGPVVDAARAALAAEDVDLILPYVKADAEAELIAAFEHTLEVRALGGEAASLADRYFFETAVRLHRAGEGAAYTGLKESVEISAGLEAAENALQSGTAEEVVALLIETAEENIAKRFAAVEEARAAASAEESVAANRKRVEAELGFELYINDLYNQVTSSDSHSETEAVAAQGHQH